jgi:hypothetical protein
MRYQNMPENRQTTPMRAPGGLQDRTDAPIRLTAAAFTRAAVPQLPSARKRKLLGL